MPALFRRYPAFRRLWAAGAVSLVGDWLSFVAVSALALTSGGGAMGLALVFAAHALPAALLSPFAGALVDGLDRRRVLVGADLIASVATLAMAGAAVAGWLGVVQVLLLVRSATTALIPPGETAALRRLVGDEDRVAANSLLAATWSIAYVAGMALGGAAALLGPALALAIDAATFLAAAAIHATLPSMRVGDGVATDGAATDGAAATEAAATEAPATRGVLAILRATPADTAAALRVAGADRQLLRAVLGKMPLALAGGAAWVAINVVAAAALPFGAVALSFGLLHAIRGAGTGIGPAIAARLLRRGAGDAGLQIAARTTMLVAVAGLAVARSPWTLSIVALAWGMGTGANWVLSHVALQRHADDAVIGRLAAFDELLVTLSMVGSALLGAVIATAFDPAAAALAAVALGLAGLAAAWAIEARAGRTAARAVEPAIAAG